MFLAQQQPRQLLRHLIQAPYRRGYNCSHAGVSLTVRDETEAAAGAGEPGTMCAGGKAFTDKLTLNTVSYRRIHVCIHMHVDTRTFEYLHAVYS